MAQHKHLFLPDIKESIPFTSASTGGKQLRIPDRNVATQSQKLIAKFNSIWVNAKQERTERAAVSIRSREGTYLEFKSSAGHDLVTKSLEDVRQGIRLLNVRQQENDGEDETVCTVYIPAGKENFFLKKINDYANPEKLTIKNNPKNKNLVNSIEDISIALVESLWTDPLELMPNGVSKWCEVWLRHDDFDSDSVIASFQEILLSNGIEFKQSVINFNERAVVIIKANKAQLSELIAQTDYLAEIRVAQEAAGFWTNQSNSEQQEWVQDLLQRLQINDNITVRVCILDSGVNNGHSLLMPILEDHNCLTVSPTWLTTDHESGSGHGTLMSGIAAYNNLEQILETTGDIIQSHKLCSVKIIPPPSQGETPIELWGDVTAQAISRAEISLPEERKVYCMAVTSSLDIDRGRPSSWSGAIDKIAYGENNNKRLFIISAGNVRDSFDWALYPDSNLTRSVHNPAQSWNSLVVGAYTEKIEIKDDSWSSYTPIASKGCLSPFSSTSFIWEKKWPIKPDLVFEGGNILKNDSGDFVDGYEDFGLLSTAKSPSIRQFDTINATSAATAKASWMAAKIMASYPDAWPETTRGLLIHSAEWSDEMFSQFNKNRNSKADVKDILRIFGYGVPNVDKALFSYNNSFTYISQNVIQPFKKDGSQYKTNEMHFFELPWPKEVLTDNPDMEVTMKITLSYFIEPGVGEVGWKDKYRYRSHGLCFEVNSQTEGTHAFQSRINKAMRDEEEDLDSDSDSSRWTIGMQGRKSGSVHSDSWTGTAAQLAECNLVAVFPVIGWWRQRTHLNKTNTKTRYSLIVTLETPAAEIELYTPVETTIQNLISVPIPTGL
jgi:hypothetical protein